MSSVEPLGPNAQPGSEPATQDGIPRVIYLARILWLCFFPLATVILGDLVLLLVPQAREALLAFDNGGRDSSRDIGHIISQAFSFEAGYLLWMISAWYVARLLVGRRFQPDLVGVCCSAGFATRVTRYLPRALAVIAGLPVALVLVFNRELWWLGSVLLVSCALVFVGLVFRRQVAHRLGHEWVNRWNMRGRENVEHFDGLTGSAWIFIVCLFLLSFGLLLGIPSAMEQVARPIGAPALVLLALMSWTIFGGFVLTYLPKSWGVPSVAWIAVVALFAFWSWNENHAVAPPVAGVQNAQRQELAALFSQWQGHRPDRAAPVIFIASAGGASRAAYWTTSALGKLEDEAHASSRKFADNVFVISAVSGGSLGAAAFVTTLDLTRRAPADGRGCRSVRRAADRFTGQDHLATVVGMMVFPDLLQRFLPVPVAAWDRSRGLEEVWQRDWDELLRRCSATDASRRNPWQQAFTSLYAAGGEPLPSLALNSTALQAGQLVMQANFRLARTDSFDLLSADLATGSLTLAQAVHNSARFPYISPAGVVKMAQPPAGHWYDKLRPQGIWDRLGDGGYIEASGTLALAQIIQQLRQARMIRTAEAPGACVNAYQDASDCYITEAQVRVLILDNSPTNGNGYICWPAGGAGAAGVTGPAGGARAGVTGPAGPADARVIHPQNVVFEGAPPWPPGADFISPLMGAFTTRGGRGVSAEIDLRALVGGCTSQFAELRLPKPTAASKELEPSMNWMLNRSSRQQIDAVLDTRDVPAEPTADAIPRQLLQSNLDLVRTWFSQGSPPR